MRLIDKDALADNIAVLFERNQTLIDEWLMYCVEDEITDAPTIDAEPVRHGHWIKQKYEDTEDSATDAWECSICGEGVVWRTEEDIDLEKYCYNCGAKMDGETT